jgi:hypothetical protein
MSKVSERIRFKQRRHDVLAALGGTFITIQQAERMIKFCLVYVLRADEEALSFEVLQKQSKEQQKTTLGGLMARLRARYCLARHFDEEMRSFLELRNQFVHDLGSVEGLGFESREELDITMAFLDRLYRLADHIAGVFLGVARVWEEQHGLDDDWKGNKFFERVDRTYKPLVDELFTPKEK